MFSNTLTIVVMAVWTIIALWGFYRGAMRTVISISILIISIAAAVFVSPKVNDMFTSSKTVNAMAMQRSEKFVEARIRNLEDGSGDLILRLYEAKRADTACRLTLGIPAESACLCDLLENPGESLDPRRMELRFHPFEIKTVRIRPVRTAG